MQNTELIYKEVNRKVSKYYRSGLDPDEITQNVVVELWEKFSDKNVDTFLAWSYANTRIRKSYRKKSIEDKHLKSYGANSKYLYNHNHDQRLEIEEYMSVLDDVEKSVLSMIYCKNMTKQEVGDVLHKSRYAIHDIEVKAINKIRDHFNIQERKYDKKDAITKDLLAGMSLNKTARSHNADVGFVRKIAKSLGINRVGTPKSYMIPKKDLIKILAKHKGIMTHAINDLENVSIYSLRRWVRRYKIDINQFKDTR